MTNAPPDPVPLAVGDVVTLDVGPVAHGGFCVARHEGRVVFVRHALPGERVNAQVTEAREGQRFVRADCVEVLTASPHRVTPPCPYAGPGRCGGCDFQHATLDHQRELKAAVVREQFSRLAKQEVEVAVEPLAGDDQGLGWRTRVEFAVDEAGRAGLRGSRSHDIVPVDTCLIADPRILATGVLARDWTGESAVDVAAPSEGAAVVVAVPSGEADPPIVTEHVAAQTFSGTFEVSARGFWQVHPGAAAAFVDTVTTMLQPREGETALDLYAGVGLFAAALAERVGESGKVVAVESDPGAVASAAGNLAAYPSVAVVRARVDDAFGVPRPQRSGPTRQRAQRQRKLRRHPLLPLRADVVVLDPPRTGAGREVSAQVAALAPRAIAYVACDPSALARDSAFLADAGYALGELRAFDAFPMTQHVESIALFTPRPA
ncbi:tRNA/tmRNA/rRNA uracil-C5-methylase, TrmA/RlmC/RlmD family [Pedococcus dokdonensis]|uniref:tRNA/tmRNA/rRNA uracil-C5-methylase, TrmA/RlmC/RlmD family n=1 Tax=Pedococcus dokdonensis TaxID=443156 RepID=A0A1H0N3C3_9MICO|nr:class I SAM-dependent RNA methyltransferase [Pedococcus dokdonensis]SDO86870.1 tRNA/tmRNA/rRNA uracil-C5-methylase, TrmA/RlmC/RlmD family [Pedococcus dokdonensis]